MHGRDIFQSLVGSNTELTSVDKLHYLKNCVTSEAARFIANFSITAENFSPAWHALVARYENKRILVISYLDRIFELTQIPTKSADNLKQILATVKEALSSLHTLGSMGLLHSLLRRASLR